jgi:hypothetical protein
MEKLRAVKGSADRSGINLPQPILSGDLGQREQIELLLAAGSA